MGEAEPGLREEEGEEGLLGSEVEWHRLALAFEIHGGRAALLRTAFEIHRDWYGFDSLDWLPPRLDGLGAHVAQADRFSRKKDTLVVSVRR